MSMELIKIDTKDVYDDFMSFIDSGEASVLRKETQEGSILYYLNTDEVIKVDKSLVEADKYSNDLIFGKNKIKRVVNVSVSHDSVHIFTENGDTVEEKVIPARYWLLSSYPREDFTRLKGSGFYRYIRYYDRLNDFLQDRQQMRGDIYWSVYDTQESTLIDTGITYFKDMKVNDVSVLSTDIETTGKDHNDESKVLIISNTLRKNGKIVKKLFKYDDYETDSEMIHDWCSWVREENPSIIIGHNLFGFDFPYLNYCYRRGYDVDLPLGRDGSSMIFNSYVSSKRKDGSQSYDYVNAKIFGRDIVDTFFLALTYDVGRKYISYALKSIIAQEGLEKKDRQHYDASQIAKNYLIPKEWKKIVQYAKDDADDALSLFDLMIAPYFYFAQSVPKTLQQIVNTATGSQINAFLVRSYLSEGYCLPKASEPRQFEGAISFGIPGVYKNAYKLDVSSLYPSIILQYNVYDKRKDPQQNFLKMVQYFTAERLKNKALAKETGDRYYKDLEQSQKIVINSSYGLCGAPGLLFNSPENAAFITRMGREILARSVEFATGYDVEYWISKMDTNDGDSDEL